MPPPSGLDQPQPLNARPRLASWEESHGVIPRGQCPSTVRARVALDDLREWVAWAHEGAVQVKRHAGWGFSVPQGDAQAFDVLWWFAATLPFARRLLFEKGIRDLERCVQALREERDEQGRRWREWSAANMRQLDGTERDDDGPDAEETLARLERLHLQQEAEAELALREVERTAAVAESSFDTAVHEAAREGRATGCAHVQTPRPRARRAAARRAAGPRSGQDPGGDDPPGEPAPLAVVIPSTRRLPPRPTIYAFPCLSREHRLDEAVAA